MLKIGIIVLVIIVLFVVVFFLVRNKKPKNNEETYDYVLKNIMKTYKNVILKITELPFIGKHSVVFVNSIDDLVYLVEFVRKSIFYIEGDNCCDFILIHDNVYYVYCLKSDPTCNTLFEDEYAKLKLKKSVSKEILEDVDKTVIIKINDGRCFRVSPIREKK